MLEAFENWMNNVLIQTPGCIVEYFCDSVVEWLNIDNHKVTYKDFIGVLICVPVGLPFIIWAILVQSLISSVKGCHYIYSHYVETMAKS